MTDTPRKQPFDEQAALAELERLRDAIQAARRSREAASEEFERFVRGFRTPPPERPAQEAVGKSFPPEAQKPKPSLGAIDDSMPAGTSAQSPAAAPVAQPATVPAPATVAEPFTVEEPAVVAETPALAKTFEVQEPATVAEPLALAEPFEVQEPAIVPEPPAPGEPATVRDATVSEPDAGARPQTSPAPVSGSRKWIAVAVVALLVIAAAGWILLGPRVGGKPPSSPAPAAVPQESPVAGPSTPAPAATPAPPVEAAGVSVELTAVNAVWVRVVVDGRKELEDTIPAGRRLQFSGERSIVVRAGSGGDLMVSSGGREERFGAAGQPLTRAFSRSGADR